MKALSYRRKHPFSRMAPLILILSASLLSCDRIVFSELLKLRVTQIVTSDYELYAMRGGVIPGWTSYDSYILDADIYLSVNYAAGWTPVGSAAAPFRGELHGNGHTISNLTISGAGDNQGLFGYLSGAVIEGVVLNSVSINVTSGSNTGALAGYSNSSTISNCSVTGGSVSGDDNVGGIVGHNIGTINNCSGNVPVSADDQIGGLVGVNSGTITYSHTSVSAPVQGNLYIGGLIGVNEATATVNHCYAANNVTGISSPFDTGGLIGRNKADISLCFATGDVTGEINVGGLVGWNRLDAEITRCYARGNTSGTAFAGGFLGEIQPGGVINYSYATGLSNGGAGGGLVGGLFGATPPDPSVTNSFCNDANTDNGYGTELSLANLQIQASFPGWDFGATWSINPAINGGYPYLTELPPP
jgi:hypothetical protein